MRSLSLRLRFTDQTVHPMHAFISEDDRYGPTRLLQWNLTSPDMSLMVFQIAGPEGPYTAKLDETASIQSYESVSVAAGADQFTLFVRDAIAANTRSIFDGYEEGDIVVVPPVVFNTDYSAEIQFIGPNNALQEMLDRFPDGIDVEIRQVSNGGTTQNSPIEQLTARQRRVIAAASHVGYYDEPRDATLEDVAAEVDLATGTVGEHIRKAEATLVEHALGDGVADEHTNRRNA